MTQDDSSTVIGLESAVNKSNSGEIVGIVVGIFLGILLLLIVAIVWKRRKTEKKQVFTVELMTSSGDKVN